MQRGGRGREGERERERRDKDKEQCTNGSKQKKTGTQTVIVRSAKLTRSCSRNSLKLIVPFLSLSNLSKSSLAS